MAKKKHIVHSFEYTNTKGETYYCDGPNFIETFVRFTRCIGMMPAVEEAIKKIKKGE